MKYTPQHQEAVIEPITTPNKNIQSFFMRTDHSYYVPESQRYPAYAADCRTVVVVVDNGRVSVLHAQPEGKISADCVHHLECSAVRDCRYNVGEHHTFERCGDVLYGALHGYLKDKVKPCECAAQVIFCDFVGRSEVVSLADVFLNQLGFRAAMLLPLSLAASLALSQNYCAFVYRQGFSFVDDFMLADSFIYPGVHGGPHTGAGGASDAVADAPQAAGKVDNEDFVEEFSRLKALDESLRYSCDSCECREATEEKIQAHIEKEHKAGTFLCYSPGGSFTEVFGNRLRYLFAGDKAEKIRRQVFSVGVDIEGATAVADIHLEAVRGASLFARLDCSKECWMTDREWRAVRLRALKEKVLFFV